MTVFLVVGGIWLALIGLLIRAGCGAHRIRSRREEDSL